MFIQNRADRLAGLQRYLHQWNHIAQIKALESDLQGLDIGVVTAEEEISFMERFGRALLESEIDEGMAWDALQPIRLAAVRAKEEVSPGEPWGNYFNSDHSTVFLTNLNACMKHRREHPKDPLRVHLALSALTQVHGLLNNYLWKQVLTPIHKLPEPHNEAGLAMHGWLDLSWVPGLPATLSDIRDGWNHGYSELHSDGLLVLDRNTRKPKAKLDLALLERYVLLGKATWTAFQLDLMFGAAAEQRSGETLRMSTIPDRFRSKRDAPS